MKHGRKTFYDGVLDIPEATVNDHKITHLVREAGEEVPLCTMRGKIMGGQRGPTEIKYNARTHWHQLSYDGGVWMTDFPIEQRQHDELLAPIRNGTVLVGGLGLGYAATVLAQRQGIKGIVVVEKSPEVVKLVEAAMRANIPQVEHKIDVVTADLFDYLRDRRAYVNAVWGPPRPKGFTHAFYDIWQMDGEGVFHDTVVPLIAASEGLVRHPPICWNEDVMRGQLFHGLIGWAAVRDMNAKLGKEKRMQLQTLKEMATRVPDEDSNAKWMNWRVPYFKWLLDAKPTSEIAQEGAAVYARRYGQWGWQMGWSAWSVAHSKGE